MCIENVPILYSKLKIHDSFVVLSNSIVLSGQHMRKCVAELNASFVVKKLIRHRPYLTGFKINKKAVRKNERKWKHRKV